MITDYMGGGVCPNDYDDGRGGKLSAVECVGTVFETSGAEVLDWNPPTC